MHERPRPAKWASDSRMHALEPEPVDLAHREHLRLELADQLPLAGVEGADADERDAARLDRRERPGVAREARRRRARAPRRAASRGRCRWASSSGVLRSPCASIHSTPPGPCTPRHPAERPDRDRVVAAEHERDAPPVDRVERARDAIRSQVALTSGR